MRAVVDTLAALALCAVATAYGTEAENRSLWYDPDDAVMFVSALKERGIPYRQDAEGGIWYPASKVGEIDSIASAVRSRCSPATSFRDPRDKALFESRLRESGVPFTRCRNFGEESVKVDAKFQKRAAEIRDAIDDESIRRHQDELNRQRSGK